MLTGWLGRRLPTELYVECQEQPEGEESEDGFSHAW